MHRGFRASAFAIVSLAGVVWSAGCEVGYQPRPIYARPMYYPPPPAQPAYGQPPPPSYASSQGGPPQPGEPPPPSPSAPCIDPGPQDIPDRFDQAMRVEAQSETVGCVVSNDADMFAVTAPPAKAGVVIHFSLRGSDKITPRIQIYDADRKSRLVQYGPESGEVRGWTHVAGGTVVYFKASQLSSFKGQYTLALTGEPLNDPDEPNNDIDHPTVAHEGKPVRAFMSAEMNDSASAVDYYKVDLRHDGSVTLDVDMIQGVDPTIAVFDADRKQVGKQYGQVSEHMHYTLKLKRGLYYVKIFPYSDLASAGSGELPVRLERQYQFTILPARE